MKTSSFILAVLGAALLTSVLPAAPRTSASYSLTAETSDAGGRKTGSPAYANDGSIGGVGGLSTVAAPAQTAKHSYIGQLCDVTNLALAASPPSVNEGATTQLSARAAMDDGTVLNPTASSVAWRIAAGPINSINPAGLATAGLVYQNTAAT